MSLSSDVNGVTITGRDTYTKTETSEFLNAKANASDVTTSLNTKQATLSAGTASTGSQSILSGSTIKKIVPGPGISLSSDVNSVTVTGRDSYTKSEVDTKISSLIGTAPAILDTVQELSASINNDAFFQRE